MTPEDAIYELVQAAAGSVQVIFSEENGDWPPRPYITLALRWAQASPAEDCPVDNDGMQSVRGHRDATAELQSFGNGAYDALDHLVLKLQHPAFEERADALGLALYEVGRLQNIPIKRDDVRYERRGVLELGIRYALDHSAFVGACDAAQVALTVTGGLTSSLETQISAAVESSP